MCTRKQGKIDSLGKAKEVKQGKIDLLGKAKEVLSGAEYSGPAFVNTLDCQKGDIGVHLSSAKLVLRRDSTFSVEKVFCFSAKTIGKGLEHQLYHI